MTQPNYGHYLQGEADLLSPILSANHSPGLEKRTESPTPVNVTEEPLRRFTRTQLLRFLLKTTGQWVITGVCIMIVGIGIVQAGLLPRIYICPGGATCPNSYDPKGNVLQLVQTLMQYWLQIGTTVASCGLVKLMAYQSWFVMKKQGNTIENLDLNIGAIKGSSLDAARLLLKRGNRSLSVFALGQVGISSAISLIVGLSIFRAGGYVSIDFYYPTTLTLPNSSLRNLNTDQQLAAIGKVEEWLLRNDTSHGLANGFQGTLVSPDNRTVYATNSQPAGARIAGDVSCTGLTNYTITDDGLVGRLYDVYYRGHKYTAMASQILGVCMAKTDTASTLYLWASNKGGRIPNAAVTSDGGVYLAVCNHTISMNTISQTGSASGTQYIQPSQPVTSGCTSPDNLVCAADSVNNAIISWYGGLGTAFWGISCRDDVLGPMNDAGQSCTISATTWTTTVTTMLDAIVQTAPRSGNATQHLSVAVEARSVKRWWLQALVPLATVVLYALAVGYTVMVSRGYRSLKELDLGEVIMAAQTDDVRHLVRRGVLRKDTNVGTGLSP